MAGATTAVGRAPDLPVGIDFIREHPVQLGPVTAFGDKRHHRACYQLHFFRQLLRRLRISEPPSVLTETVVPVQRPVQDAAQFPRELVDQLEIFLLAITDGNRRIRVAAASTGSFYGQAMTAGDIYTVAGDGTQGLSGDGGPATSAELLDPQGVAVDSAGNLVIADARNNRVRVAAASTGSFYGQPMSAGDIYTVAGDGTGGFSGDGGPAANAGLNSPLGVAVDAAGDLVIADFADNRIRKVTG
jgi:NHL repeat-containing protein